MTASNALYRITHSEPDSMCLSMAFSFSHFTLLRFVIHEGLQSFFDFADTDVKMSFPLRSSFDLYMAETWGENI